MADGPMFGHLCLSPGREIRDHSRMNPLAPFAALVAPHIDRLVLAVHHQMRVARPDEAESWVASTGLERPGIMINLRPFILAGRESESTLRRLHRYVLPASVDASIATARGAGLLENDSFRATDKARDVAERLTLLQTALMEELWGGRPELDLLLPVLNRLVDCIPARYPGRCFELARDFASLPRPVGSDAYVVHHLATSLRYLRADCHSEVLAEAELGSTDAVLLAEVWRSGEAVGEHAPAELVERGLLTEHGALTTAGREFRDAIENETNSAAAAIWEAVDEPARTRALANLETLDHQRGEARL